MRVLTETELKGEIPRQVSYKKKIANNYQRQRELMDLADWGVGWERNIAELDKINMNYDLQNGRLDVLMYEDPVCINIDGETVKLDDLTITHYPLIAQIDSSIQGEMISRPFKPVAKDTGEYSQTLRNKKFNELLRELINDQVVNPIRDEVTSSFLAQAEVSQNMTPEQIQQIQGEIENRIKAKTPEEILDFMVNDFRTPTQRQAQQLLDYFSAKYDFKTLQSEGFKHARAAGVEVYYVGDEHGEPVVKLCNPKHIRWGGSRNNEWVQDASWVSYEEWLTVEDALQELAEHLSELSNKELMGFIEPIGGFRTVGDPRKDSVQRTMMIDLSDEHSELGKKYEDVNYKTKKGQNSIANLYTDIIAKYGGEYGMEFGNYGVRKVHICWRDQRKMKFVTRLINGEEKTMWFDEHYEERAEDIKVIDIWVNEIWEGTKVGSVGADVLYLNIRPIPNQWPSRYNPFGTKLPYYGKKYNSPMNNSKNIAWIDLGKSWQMEFDVTMARLKHEMKVDMGKMFLMFLELRPEGWKWQDWINTGKNTGLLFSNLKRHGGALDPNLLRPIDLSRASRISELVGFLEFCRTNLIQTLNFNDARLGAIGQYSTNQNVQQSQIASYNQTEAMYETHRLIFEKALNAFMNRAKSLYKTNNKRFLILDDVARTELEISPDFWYEEWAIQFSTSADEIKKVQELKMQMQAFIQNGMSFEGILALALANTTSDIEDIMKKENKRMEAIRVEQMTVQQNQITQQLEANKQEKDADRQTLVQLELAKLGSQERRAIEQSNQFLKQADADRDGQSDILEKSEMELLITKLIEDRKADLKQQEITNNKELKEKELQIKNKDTDNKVTIAKSKPKPAASKSK